MPLQVEVCTNTTTLARNETRHVVAEETWKVPPSKWQHLSHPRFEKVAREVDGYFLKNWHFPDARAREKFLKAGFSRATCLYFPLAKDDRVHFACRLLTVLFLVDGTLSL